MKTLVMGTGVIGSVYAGHLGQAGHEVTLLARGSRLDDLTRGGLVLLRQGGGAQTGRGGHRVAAG